MKKIITALMLLSFFLLAACGESGSGSGGGENTEASLEPVKVHFLTESNAFKPGQEGIIQVKVSQGGENISNADEVLFEVWKKGKKDASEKFEAKNDGDGIYSLVHTFSDNGIYKVTAHVTANAMHTMPTMEFNVGGVEEDNQTHGNHHGESELTVMLMKADTVTANKEATLTAHLQNENKPFTEASVKFEYWKDGQAKHTFVETREKEAGKYQATITFNEPGMYHVKTHVKKGDIHTHKEETINVQ